MKKERKSPPKELSEVTQFLVERLKLDFPERTVATVQPITPDASLRRYYRVCFSSVPEGTRNSVVAMLFDAVSSPEATGSSIESDEAYVELSRFFEREGVAVPGLLVDAREESLLIIEDLGDRALVDLARAAEDGNEAERLELRTAFQSAIREIERIQKITKIDDFFAYRRSFQASTYVREMEEFRDYCLLPLDPPKAVVQTVEALFSFLGELLESFPQVLVHRDFHAWNLLVDFQNRVRVIDFQDALVATGPYDLVSLLNDRDMDSLLGRDLYRELVVYGSNCLGGGEFLFQYDRVLLQRDLKVSGRFAKLVKVRGLNQYGAWIPGTLRRIGRTIERVQALGAENTLYREFYEVVHPFLPEIEKGYADAERFLA